MNIYHLVACLMLLEGGPGDNGLGHGPLSIHHAALVDYNKAWHNNLRVEDLDDPEIACEVAAWYVTHYTPKGAPIWRHGETFNRGPGARHKTDYGRRLENLYYATDLRQERSGQRDSLAGAAQLAVRSGLLPARD